MTTLQLEKFKEQQENRQNKNKNDIKELVNEYLKKLGVVVKTDFENLIKVNNLKNLKREKISYAQIKQKSGIKDKEDIVWIKFNTNGCISVIGGRM